MLITTTMIGQLLGFLRTKLINANFSAYGPQSTDTYFAAFTIPDFFFYTLAAGALGVALMPFLSDRLQKGDKKGMWELAGSLLNLLTMVMFGVALLIFIFAEPLIKTLVAPDLSPEQLHTTATIMRLLSLNPLLFTISGILTALEQTLGQFFFYAIAPLFYNSAIIASIYIFKDSSIGIVGLGIGAAAGAVLQLLIVALGLYGTRFRWRPKIMWRSADLKTVLRQLPARSIDQGIDQIQAIIETNFARRLGEGFVSFYNNAYTLHMAPILLLGTTISTAAFPRLNLRISQGRPDLFRRDFSRILRTMIWLTIPVVIVSYFARGYLARLIFSRNAPEISLIFGFLTVAILFRIVYTIMSRWYYAQKDTRTPLFVSLFVIALNIALSATLARPAPDGYGIAGLAIAQSIVAFCEVLILVTVMIYRDRKVFDKEFIQAMIRIMSVAGFALIAGAIVMKIFPLSGSEIGFVTLGSKLGAITAIIFTVYVSISALFGLDEAKIFFDRLKRIITSRIKVQY